MLCTKFDKFVLQCRKINEPESLYIYIRICIWSVWKHFGLIKFINADAYNPQEGGGVTIDLILCELIVEVTSVRDRRGQSRKVC